MIRWTRRQLLLSTPLLAAADGLRVRPACQTNAWRINPAKFEEVAAVIEKIKSYGYQGYESGFRNFETQFASPWPARGRLDRIGLEFMGIHLFLLEYDKSTSIAPWELITRVADGGAAMGAKRLILSGAPAAEGASRIRKVE